MPEITTTENGLSYDGQTVCVERKRNKMVLNLDGRKIKMSEDEYVLAYIFFSVMFKALSEDPESDAAAMFQAL